MISCSFQPWNFVAPVSAAIEEGAERFAMTGMLGLILMAIVEIPVLAVIIASILETRRNPRVPVLFLGAFALAIGVSILGIAILGIATKFLVPQ